MSNLEWNDELRMELLRLKAEISPENLRVLSKGLGLGVTGKRVVTVVESNDDVSFSKPPVGEAQPQQNFDQVIHPRSQPEVPELQPFWGRIKRVLLVHLVDLTFIVLCLMLGALSLAFVFQWGGLGTNYWQQLQDFLKNQGYVFLASAIYGLFVVYFIFFRTFLGKTLGEELISSDYQKN